MKRAILLDLGRVIVPFDFSIGYKLMHQRTGLAPELIRERIRATGLVPRFETGLIEPRDFVETLMQDTGLNIPFADFCEIWSSIFSREILIPEDWIEALHSRYRTVLVSNTNALHFEMIRANYPFLRHFDALVLSYEVKAMKPDPAIFAAAVAAARCAPEECFFTDDIPEYVEGARRFGIDAVPFRGAPQLAADLEERRILIGPIKTIDRSAPG